MSRIGRKPIPVPDAVTVEVAPGSVAVKGPKGELSQALLRRHEGRAGGRHRHRRPPDRPRRAPRAARADQEPDREHGRGRHRRLREAPRDPGRRLPRRSSKARASRWRSASPTRSRSSRRRGSSSRSRSRPRSSSAASTSSWSARSPRTSASVARPSPTRARAIRYRDEHVAPQGRQAGLMTVVTKRQSTAAPPPPGPRPGRRQRRAPAPVRLPLEPRDLRPADRRPSRATRWPRSTGSSPSCAS